jgi:hypothetical protein
MQQQSMLHETQLALQQLQELAERLADLTEAFTSPQYPKPK